MASVSTAAPEVAEDHGLKREVGIIGLIWASEGSIIGSGWLFGALFAAKAAGPAAVLSWIIATIAVVVIAMVLSELGAMYPVVGGTGRFPHYAYGSAAGASFGWFSWLQAAAAAPIEVLALMSYGSVHLPWLIQQTGASKGQLTAAGYGISVAFMAVFVGINFFGIRWLARTNSAATWWKVAIPLLLIAVLLVTHFHTSNFSAAGGFAPYGARGVLYAISTAGVMFALNGFEQADQLAGEAKNPQRDIPRAIIGAVLIGAAIYLLLQIVFILALPKTTLAHGWAALSFTGDAGPFAGLATLLGLGWLATILYIDAIISPSGSGLIYTTTTSRISFGLSRNGYVPAIFEKTDQRGVPWFSLIFTFIAGLIFFLPFPSWHQLVGFITSASVLMYAGGPLAFGALRKQQPRAARPYRMPAGGFWSPVAFIIANLIIYWSGWNVIWRLGAAIVLGYVLIGLSIAFKANPNTPSLDWKSAQWLPAYLIGLGIISWQGTFGTGAAGHLGLWWDILVIAVFSLVIYYWAIAVRLPDAKAEEYISHHHLRSQPGE